MAKDDFFVILFKILTYYYGCMKNRYVFKEEVFFKIAKGNIDDSYFNKVLKDAVDMGYIKGLAFTHAWGDEYILSSDYTFITGTICSPARRSSSGSSRPGNSGIFSSPIPANGRPGSWRKNFPDWG